MERALQTEAYSVHQYLSEQYHEVELCDDSDVLRQGGSDGGNPSVDYDLGPGPVIESLDSSFEDPADIPIPDDGTDFDLEDGDFWTKWLAGIKADEYHFTEVFIAQQRRHDNNNGGRRTSFS